MISILDASPYPWDDPAANKLHQTLNQIQPDIQSAILCAQRAGVNTTTMAPTGAFFLWKNILTQTAVEGLTRGLVQQVHDSLHEKSPYRPYLGELLVNLSGMLPQQAAHNGVEREREPRQGKEDNRPIIPSPGPHSLWAPMAGIALASVLVIGLLVWPLPTVVRTPTTASHTVPKEENTAASQLETILDKGPGKAAQSNQPQLGLDLLRWQRQAQTFELLKDGAELQSGIGSEDDDLYMIAVRPATPGHLYVFQVDAQNKLTWFFPQNEDRASKGAAKNPVAGNIPILIPPADRRTGLSLDRTVGKEHVFAILSAAPWPELEEALAIAVRSPAPTTIQRPKERGPGDERQLPERAKAKWGNLDIQLGDRVSQTTGRHVQVVRWFKHN